MQSSLMKERELLICAISFQHLEKIYSKEKSLVLLLSQTPGGLLLDEIEKMVSLNPFLYGQWQGFLEDMIYNN